VDEGGTGRQPGLFHVGGIGANAPSFAPSLHVSASLGVLYERCCAKVSDNTGGQIIVGWPQAAVNDDGLVVLTESCDGCSQRLGIIAHGALFGHENTLGQEMSGDKRRVTVHRVPGHEFVARE